MSINKNIIIIILNLLHFMLIYQIMLMYTTLLYYIQFINAH